MTARSDQVGKLMLEVILVAGLCALLTGCGFGAIRNVRAFRAYANEPSNAAVALDRTEDLAETLRLIDEALAETPYRPGDPWVQKLALTDEKAAKLKAQIRSQKPYTDPDFEVPIVKIYRLHLAQVLAEAKAERALRVKAAAEDAEGTGDEDGDKSDGDKDKDTDKDKDKDKETTGEGSGAAGEGTDDASEKKAEGEDKDGAKEGEGEGEGEGEKPKPVLEPGEYACILDAMSELAPGKKSITEQWADLGKAEKKLAALETEKDRLVAQYAANLQPGQAAPPEVVAARKAVSEAEDEIDKIRLDLVVQTEALSRADTKDKRRARIVKDSLVAASVALRVDLESLALIPVVIVQAARSVTSAPKDLLAQKSLKVVDQIAELPDRGEQIEEHLMRQLAITQTMANALSGLTGKDLADTAGFSMQESVVDQVVGVTLDSFRVNLKAGGEALFFAFDPDANQSSTTTESSDGSSGTTTSYDFTGRKYRLEYAVDPIWMIAAKLNVGFDFFHFPNAANLNFGFATDRAFSSGGTIDNSRGLGQQLGLEGVASDVFDGGLGILGVKSKVKVAKFTAGEVQLIQVDQTNGADVAIRDVAPLQLGYTQIDVGYDISFLFPETAGRYWIEELTLGFKYLDYKLPRILYEMEDTNSSTSVQDYRYLRETRPQTVDSQYYMGGLVLRLGQGGAPFISIFADLGIFGGGGPTSFFFDEPVHEDWQASVFAFNAELGGGLRLRITPKKSRLRVNADFEYHGELIWQQVTSQPSESDGSVELVEGKTIQYGGTDIFHGPRLNLVASF